MSKRSVLCFSISLGSWNEKYKCTNRPTVYQSPYCCIMVRCCAVLMWPLKTLMYRYVVWRMYSHSNARTCRLLYAYIGLLLLMARLTGHDMRCLPTDIGPSSVRCPPVVISQTTLFAIRGSNNKKTKKTKKKKRNTTLQDKSNTTRQHNSILGLIEAWQDGGCANKSRAEIEFVVVFCVD